MFDFNPKQKCCNCISIVLYLKGTFDQQGKYYKKCIPQMIQSMENIKTALPNFVIRFYLDCSVFKFLCDKFDIERENKNI